MSGSHGTHTHWGMTINNYTDTDLALLHQGYPDHIRQIIYTLEEGKEGTPHVQAFIKMKRDCRWKHMMKLFPRGYFVALTSSEFKLNTANYAQKLDDTARGPATITNGDPLHTIEGIVRVIALAMVEWYHCEGNENSTEWEAVRRVCEADAVKKDYTMAKVFVSATYKAMWKDWGHEMYQNIFHTHTHTHTQVVDVPPPPTYFLKEIREIGTQTDEWDVSGEGDDEEEPEGSDEEDDDASGIIYEDGSDEDSEESDRSSV